jgi:hypothetical protein
MSRRAVLALLAAGGGLTLLAATQPWVTLTVQGDLGTASAAVTGSALAPLVTAAGVVALAGTLAALVVRTWGRRVVGVLVLLVAAAALVQLLPVAVSLQQRGRSWWAVEVGAAAQDAAARTAPWWPWLAVVGLLLAAAAAAAVLARGSAWSGLAGRYEAGVPVASSDPWTTLDRGVDPTGEPSGEPPGDRAQDPGTDAAPPPTH